MKKIILGTFLFWAGAIQAGPAVPLEQSAIDVANLMLQPVVRICLDNVAAQKRGRVIVNSISKVDNDDLYLYSIKGVVQWSNDTASTPFAVSASNTFETGAETIQCWQQRVD